MTLTHNEPRVAFVEVGNTGALDQEACKEAPHV